jgi:DNA-binding NarL/FixJ family response regulator
VKVIEVLVHAFDEISQAGVVALLSCSPQMRLRVDAELEATSPEVVVLVVDGVAGTDAFAYLRRIQSRAGADQAPRCVIVADHFRPEDVLAAVECGVAAILRRSEIKDTALVHAVQAVSRGAALIPATLQGVLLEQLTQLRLQVLAPEDLTLSGLQARECDVLKLIAEGLHTDEIAKRLTYSEGTVKNVLYGLMSRLGLSSRSHAVAYAMRAGVI